MGWQSKIYQTALVQIIPVLIGLKIYSLNMVTIMSKGTKEEELSSVKLRVHRSRIPVGGRARIHKDVLVQLQGPEIKKMKDGEIEHLYDMIVIATEKKRILVKAFWDTLMSKDVISLRPPDLEKLGISHDEEVNVYLHEHRKKGKKHHDKHGK